MAAWLNVCRYAATAGGTADFTYANAVTGYQSPAAAGVVNATVYRYRAESSDLTQWEIGFGAYTTGTNVLARTTVLYNSSGTGTGAGQSGAGTKISFSSAPQVAIVALAEDMTGFVLDTGDTMTGDLTIGKNDGALVLSSTLASNSVYPRIRFAVSGVPRWEISSIWGPETGSNVGSDFSIDRFNDAGTIIDSPVFFTRSTGSLTITGDIYFTKASPVLTITKTAAGQQAIIAGSVVGLGARWQFALGDVSPEAGSNAGSDFGLYRYSDVGAFLGTALYISRASGNATFSGDVAANGEISWTGSAWTNYTPTLTFSGGTGTATGRYKAIGKTIHFTVTIFVTGTGSIVNVSLPTTTSASAGNITAMGRELNVTGLTWNGTIAPGTSTMGLVNTSNSNAITNGWKIAMSGTYETA